MSPRTMWRMGFTVVVVAGVAVAACGPSDRAAQTDPAPSPSADACAFLENVTAPGVGPIVIFVTRGPGAQSACDAEVADPRNKSQDIRPAYVPPGTPVCTYSDSHDPPPEGGRRYEVYGDGATAVCHGMAPDSPSRPTP
jgi:hypothetical protein